MDEAARVGSVECARHLRHDPDRFRRVHRAALEALPQILSLHVAHRDEEEIVIRRPRLVDRDDVRVVDGCGQLRLAEEAFAERLVLGEGLGQKLERDPAFEPPVLREVHDAHTAPAQERLDPVAGELGADSGVVAHMHVRILTFVASRER